MHAQLFILSLNLIRLSENMRAFAAYIAITSGFAGYKAHFPCHSMKRYFVGVFFK